MKRIVSALVLTLISLSPAAAQQTAMRTWVDSHGTTWTEVTTTQVVAEQPRSERIAAVLAGLPQFGPFTVVDSAHAALAGEIDSASPGLFKAMMQAHPGIRVLEMVDCAGTTDDGANFELGRLIRAHGLVVDVPSGGSVRSGGVELFLAGASRHAAEDAEFGVHAWRDELGHQPGDYAPDAPANQTYLDYYREMGLTSENATGLYALTNSVPNEQVLWLKASDLKRFVALD